MIDEDLEHKLAFDIWMGLCKSPHAGKVGHEHDPLKLMADDVVDHLKLCNWEFRRREPEEPVIAPSSREQSGE